MLPVVLFDGVDGADVGVVQGRSGACLALKSLDKLGVFRHLDGQEFQRHAPSQSSVFRLVHHTHPTASYLSCNFVMGENLADQRRSFRH